MNKTCVVTTRQNFRSPWEAQVWKSARHFSGVLAGAREQSPALCSEELPEELLGLQSAVNIRALLAWTSTENTAPCQMFHAFQHIILVYNHHPEWLVPLLSPWCFHQAPVCSIVSVLGIGVHCLSAVGSAGKVKYFNHSSAHLQTVMPTGSIQSNSTWTSFHLNLHIIWQFHSFIW